ncbi:MAG: hypothetical protein LLG02_14105 [Pelosinus sp.]|nr:hypothetical protein [Pelosinus sp.]
MDLYELFSVDEKKYPNVSKIIELKNSSKTTQMKELNDYLLHADDMMFAMGFLNEINQEDEGLKNEALFYAALVLFVKCFESSRSRKKLRAEEIYKDNKEKYKLFQWMKALRDKHVAHDENAYSQTLIGGILNKPGIEPKIAEIVTRSLRRGTPEKNYRELYELVLETKSWIDNELKSLQNALHEEYEKKTYEELNKMPSPTIPDLNKVNIRKTRKNKS